MREKPHYLDTLTAELAQALGEAVWAFSMVEKLTYRYLKTLSSEPLHVLMADQPFASRIRLIRHLVDRLKGQDDAKAIAAQCLNEAEKLARIRNVLAHNPWSIWVDLDRSEFMTEIQKVTDENKTLDLVQVREFRDAARRLASDFEFVLGELHYHRP
ncbi:MAG: hypothetical protein ACTHNV_22925 [Ralstonia sp.]|uniref:hypothetical protein n=1 Tax=Ralstonia sp. TaxID=54061 RepID=UPI003F80A89D